MNWPWLSKRNPLCLLEESDKMKIRSSVWTELTIERERNTFKSLQVGSGFILLCSTKESKFEFSIFHLFVPRVLKHGTMSYETTTSLCP